jgi:putative transcriptional regulator
MDKQKLNRIKAVLADKQKTSKWLYEALGANKMTVSRWVRNENQPSLETLYEIARLLEVDVCELLVKDQPKK